MFPTGRKHQQGLGFQVHVISQQQGSELFSQGRSPGFPGGQPPVAPLAQPVGQPFDVGAFTRAVDAFKGDELAPFAHGIGLSALKGDFSIGSGPRPGYGFPGQRKIHCCHPPGPQNTGRCCGPGEARPGEQHYRAWRWAWGAGPDAGRYCTAYPLAGRPCADCRRNSVPGRR